MLGTSNGPLTPAPSGMQPGKPQPNCNDEGTPRLKASYSCSTENEPQLTAGWWQQLEADAEAVNCADASERQAASDAGPRPSQRVSGMNPPSASRPGAADEP